jgi:hypothetical protein
MYFLATGVPPYYSANKKEMFKKRMHDPVPIKDSFSPEFQEILTNLLNPN